MKKFDKKYKEFLFQLNTPHRRFSFNRMPMHNVFTLKKHNLIFEMNSEVFPIPKNLLSELLQKSYENDWKYVCKYPFISIYNMIKESENIAECQIDWEKLESFKTYELLFICLPYDLKIWKKNLKALLKEDEIENLFKDFDGENGAYGTFLTGSIILINSNNIFSLKDGEEIIEHELVHMIEDINGAENILSPSMQWILDSPNELKTHVINVINSFFALYDHKQTMFTNDIDTYKSKKSFLDNIFKDAKNCKTFENFYNMYLKYCSSKLMKTNLIFFWELIQWNPDELTDIRLKIYREFLGHDFI